MPLSLPAAKSTKSPSEMVRVQSGFTPFCGCPRYTAAELSFLTSTATHTMLQYNFHTNDANMLLLATQWLTEHYGSYNQLVNCILGKTYFLWLNPLVLKGNYSVTSNNTKLVHWSLTGGLIHWYSEEGTGRAAAHPVPPRCTKCNSPSTNGQCTNHCIATWWSVAMRF